ncbi:MAG: hypothetical protein ABI439_05555 [Rhodospirillales bacterium]
MTVQDVALTPVAALAGGSVATARQPRNSAYFFGPVIDFLGLGGGSILALGLILLLKPSDGWYNEAAKWALFLAWFVNHPHFAYSYQIFYGNFRQKAFGTSLSPQLRARYVFAGIVAPILLTGFFIICVVAKDDETLALAFNAMNFFVGWHYVKQGYGMIIVDSVLKKRFFTAIEKKILLINAYLVWAASWLAANASLHDAQFWGLHHYQFAVPAQLLMFGTYLAYGAGIFTAGMLILKAIKGQRPPLNGSIAYLVSLYLWLWFVRINPFFLLIIPAFHSLQYMVVVWRYRLNKLGDQTATGTAAKSPWRHIGFATVAIVLGFIGFWGAPWVLDDAVLYDRSVFGSTLFLFMFWIFINIHHYFLDNVMWRRENPDTGKYLFGRT